MKPVPQFNGGFHVLIFELIISTANMSLRAFFVKPRNVFLSWNLTGNLREEIAHLHCVYAQVSSSLRSSSQRHKCLVCWVLPQKVFYQPNATQGYKI
jgi:hypothetical protein